jgi:hypothetical protein
MPVINSSTLLQYKTYYTESVRGKDGVTRPITKVKYVKSCPECGGEMGVTHRKGGVHKREYIKWDCPDKMCNYSEREESQEEYLQRIHNL